VRKKNKGGFYMVEEIRGDKGRRGRGIFGSDDDSLLFFFLLLVILFGDRNWHHDGDDSLLFFFLLLVLFFTNGWY